MKESTMRLKFIGNIFRGDSPSYSLKGIPVINQACIQNGTVDWTRIKFSDPDKAAKVRGWVLNNDILINSTGTGTLGRVAYYQGKDNTGFADGHITILRVNNNSFFPRFIYYVLSIAQEDITSKCSDGSTNQIELSRSEFGDYRIPNLSANEQKEIIKFLDLETDRLDRLALAKRRQLELIADKRRTLISQAVAQGIDHSKSRTSSGVAWLGDIPEGWEILQLKRIFSQTDYGISDQLKAQGKIGVLRMGDIKDGEVSLNNLSFVNQVEPNLLLRRDDLLFNRTNSLDQIGKVGLFGDTDQKISFASYLVRLRCTDRVVPEYLNFLLNSQQILLWCRNEALPAIGQANLSPSRYGYLQIALPPITEQKMIIDYLQNELSRLDNLRFSIEKSLKLIQQKRISIISIAVTGQLTLPASNHVSA